MGIFLVNINDAENKAGKVMILSVFSTELTQLNNTMICEVYNRLKETCQYKGLAWKATLLKSLAIHGYINHIFNAVNKLDDSYIIINDELLTYMLLICGITDLGAYLKYDGLNMHTHWGERWAKFFVLIGDKCGCLEIWKFEELPPVLDDCV